MCNLVCNIECDIEAIQRVTEIQTVPSPKKKKQAAEKVSRYRRKLLPRLGVQREERR